LEENARISGDLSALTTAALGIAVDPLPFVPAVAPLGVLAAFSLMHGLLDTLA
jgi:hypothetical protein